MRRVLESTLIRDAGDLVSVEARIAQAFGARIQPLAQLDLRAGFQCRVTLLDNQPLMPGAFQADKVPCGLFRLGGSFLPQRQ
jgi:hypothetical protein